MNSDYYSHLNTNLFSQLYSKTTQYDNATKMARRVFKDKKKIRTLLIQAVGKDNIKPKKPSPLRRFEKGYKEWLFGENGEITRLMPELRLMHMKRKMKQKTFEDSVVKRNKINAGDLTYLYTSISPNSKKNKELFSRIGRIRHSAFFSVDDDKGFDGYNSHSPVINKAYYAVRSPPKTELKKQQYKAKLKEEVKNKETQYKTLLLPLFTTNPHITMPKHKLIEPVTPSASNLPSQPSTKRDSTKASYQHSLLSPTHSYHNGKSKRCKSMIIIDLNNQLDDLHAKHTKAERNLHRIIDSSQTSYSFNHYRNGQSDIMKKETIKDIEAIYDIQYKSKEPKFMLTEVSNDANTLITEVKRRQKQFSNQQTMMMKVSNLIGKVNEKTVVNLGDLITQEYEKNKGVNDSNSNKDKEKEKGRKSNRDDDGSINHRTRKRNSKSYMTNAKTKSREKIDKRERLVINSHIIKKMTYNVLRSNHKAIALLNNYNR